MSKKASRLSFGETLAELGEKYPNVVCLDADLSKSTQSQLFAKKYPNRFYEMGIQEANMVGAAAGLSFTGKIPFICSFAAFITGRYDQIRMSIGYSQANVKIIGTHAGVGIGEDGHSQMGLEDIALMRAIPNMVVLQPGCDQETREMVEWAINHQGPVYLRLTRQGLKSYDLPKFQPGEFPTIKKGKGIALLANAGLLEIVENAANQAQNLNLSVYNASTAKPLSENMMKTLCTNYDELIVFEDHTVLGGTGSAISEWVAENSPKHVRVRRYGVQDVFGESGTPGDLYQKHGFTQEAIVKYLETLYLENNH